MSTPSDGPDPADKKISEDELDDVAGGAFELSGRPPTGIGELGGPSYCSGEIKAPE